MTPREAIRLTLATARTLADSERTSEIHVAEELTGRHLYTGIRDRQFGSPEAQDLLRDRPELRSDQVDYSGLRRLPEKTLGSAYVRHLDRNGLTADSQAAPTKLDEFKGNVIYSKTGQFWDKEAAELMKLRPVPWSPERPDDDPAKVRVLQLVGTHAFHYMGSVKILSLIGYGMAEDMKKLLDKDGK